MVLVLIVSLPLFIFPSKARALPPPLLEFGGGAYMYWPCTCSAGSWLYFVPLHLQGATLSGPMTFYPATFQFADRMGGSPGVKYLGGYVPGVPSCWIYAGYFCFPLYAVGTMAVIGTAPSPI